MASTAAPSAPSLSPRPIQRLAAMAAASVVRTRSMARFRSGAWRAVTTGLTIVGRRCRLPAGRARQRRYLGPWSRSWSSPTAPSQGTVRAGGAKNSGAQADGGMPARRGLHRAVQRPAHRRRGDHGRGAAGHGRAVERLDNGDVAVTTPAGRRPGTRRAPTSCSSACGRRWSCSGCCWPAAATVRMPLPGGDDFGDRPIDFHVNGLSAMGARFESSHGEVRGTVAGRPAGGHPGGAGVPEPHRHRQPAHGGRPGQGHDGDRERGQGARGGRPGRHAVRHGGGGAGGGHLADRGRGGR